MDEPVVEQGNNEKVVGEGGKGGNSRARKHQYDLTIRARALEQKRDREKNALLRRKKGRSGCGKDIKSRTNRTRLAQLKTRGGGGIPGGKPITHEPNEGNARRALRRRAWRLEKNATNRNVIETHRKPYWS